jgi:hypothetical protein
MVLLAAALSVLVGGPLLARAEKGALDETRGEATIDWGQGTVTASAGAAADFHLPSADVARPGAVRRARAAALTKLRGALAELPLGADRQLSAAAIERALLRARTIDIDYQSNGGALVKLSVDFSAWIEGGPRGKNPDAGPSPAEDSAGAVPVLAVSSMRLAGSPLIKVAGKEVAAGAARYRLGTPPATLGALRAKVERGGKLSIEGDSQLADRLAAAVVLIYVQKVVR